MPFHTLPVAGTKKYCHCLHCLFQSISADWTLMIRHLVAPKEDDLAASGKDYLTRTMMGDGVFLLGWDNSRDAPVGSSTSLWYRGIG